MQNVEAEDLELEIMKIVDAIETIGKLTMTHPNDVVKLFAASRLIDLEIAKRMEIINQVNKDNNFLVVGGVSKNEH